MRRIQVVAILKAREPARILVAIGDKDNDSPHLEYKQRWVNQYNFYVNDAQWGRMFVRMCPHFPFSARLCLNQHHWLALRMRQEGIDFEQTTNAFLKCGDPIRLQKLADSLTPGDLLKCGQKWLARLTPFFTDKERREVGCQHGTVLLTGGVLRQPHLLSTRWCRGTDAASLGPQPQHRSTEKDNHDLRPQD